MKRFGAALKNDFDNGEGQNEADVSGPWPFTTRMTRRCGDEKRVWQSRCHRKNLRSGMARQVEKWLWAPHKLNWWIGVVFATGSALFTFASVLNLFPDLATRFSLNSSINAIYFAGSILFTIAAWLQLFQTANAGEPFGETEMEGERRQRKRLFGWRPAEIGWLSCALQFVGTVLFNINTFDAMLPSLNWLQQDLEIWAPEFVGSILFLLSGYLAFIETCHSHWDWQPKSLSWWVVFMNLLGCIGFMASAGYAFVLPGIPGTFAIFMASLLTLLGSICFFVGSMLMLPETG